MRTFSLYVLQAFYAAAYETREPFYPQFYARMEEAKRLLAETSTPIWKIAEHLHYQQSAWFCFAFRRYVGETPLHYRRRFRK